MLLPSKEKPYKTLRQLAQCTLYTTDSPTHRNEWHAAKNAFDSLADTLEWIKSAHMDATLHKFGNKAGKLLARLCKGPFWPTHITSLRDTSGTIRSTPQDINKVMLQYYSSLYAPDPTDKEVAQDFLDKISIPSITPSQLKTLNAPISLFEISKTICSLAPSKAPSPDGLTGEFYKTLQNIAEPSLLKVYNSIWSGGPYLPTGNQAIIKLLSKKGKDPQEPGSYCPISLLNLDIKILSKIIASRLATIIPSLMHPAQSGFVKGRTATLNIRKVMMVLEHAKCNPGRRPCHHHFGRGKSFRQCQFRMAFTSLV